MLLMPLLGLFFTSQFFSGGFSSPLASRDNILYTGSISNALYAISANMGEARWAAPLKGSMYSRPLVEEDAIYTTDFAGRISRFDRSGKLVWEVALGGKIFATPVKWENLLFVGSSTGNFYAVRDNGTVVWQVSNTRPLSSSPVMYNNWVIVGGYDGFLSSLEARTGKLIWQIQLSNIIESSPVLAGGNIYVCTYSGDIFCVDAESGSIVWRYGVKSAIRSSPILVDGHLVVASINGDLTVLDVTNDLLTAGPTLSPLLSGKALPQAVSVETNEAIVEEPLLTNTNEVVEFFEITNVTEVVSNTVVAGVNTLTNVIFVTNTITLTNMVVVTNVVEKQGEKKASSYGNYVVQVGAFRNRSYSKALVARLKAMSWRVFETKAVIRGKTYYRVRVGYFASLDEAYNASKKLKSLGLPTRIYRLE
jgi:outer membrane protein assembly factor BamB